MKNNTQKFTCTQDKIRLDIFLSEKIPETTRSRIQKRIKSGEVTVNGKDTAVHHFLKQGDIIEVKFKEKQKKFKDNDFKLDIIFENTDFMVINKPAGIIVHQFEGILEYSIADAVVKKYPQIKNIGEDPSRPGIVHRLDKDVSGLIAIAKNNKTFEHLKNQFKDRKVKKEYLALVYGKVKNSHGTIDLPIGRSKTKKQKMAAFPKKYERGREALTEYELIKSYKNCSMLKVKIKTGRTHQIRVHLNAHGIPVVGDRVYTNKNIKNKIELDRIFLHSHRLAFIGPDKKKYEFYSYLPISLKKVLNKINNQKIFIIVSGPSGVGKTSILSELLKKHANRFAMSTTYTTREERKGKIEEKNMISIDEKEFKRRKDNDEFIEWEKVHIWHYGTDKASFENAIKEKNVITSIDVKGTKKLLDKMPESYTVFINFKDLKDLEKRLRKRGDLTEEKIELRKKTAQEEIKSEYFYDLKIFNEEGKLKQVIRDFEKAVLGLIE